MRPALCGANDLRASWPSSSVKMATPRLREVVSKTKMEDDRGNHPKSTSCLYNHIHIYQRETEGRREEGEEGGEGEIRWIKV